MQSSFAVVGDFTDKPVEICSTYDYEEPDKKEADELPMVDVSA